MRRVAAGERAVAPSETSIRRPPGKSVRLEGTGKDIEPRGAGDDVGRRRCVDWCQPAAEQACARAHGAKGCGQGGAPAVCVSLRRHEHLHRISSARDRFHGPPTARIRCCCSAQALAG